MYGNLCKEEVNIAHDSSNLVLWHRKLGHMNEKGLYILARKDLLLNIKSKLLKCCTDCLADKQYRMTFHKKISYTLEESVFLI